MTPDRYRDLLRLCVAEAYRHALEAAHGVCSCSFCRGIEAVAARLAAEDELPVATGFRVG